LSNGTNIVVEGNLLGLDPTGTAAKKPGSQGMEICNRVSCGPSQGAHIGAPNPAQRNVIVATGNAITVNGSNVIIEGNFIGTDVTGSVSLAGAFMTGGSVKNVFKTLFGGTAF